MKSASGGYLHGYRLAPKSISLSTSVKGLLPEFEHSVEFVAVDDNDPIFTFDAHVPQSRAKQAVPFPSVRNVVLSSLGIVFVPRLRQLAVYVAKILVGCHDIPDERFENLDLREAPIPVARPD